MNPFLSSPSRFPRDNRRLTLWRYLGSVMLVLAALVISIPLHYVIEAVNLVMLFLVVVLLAGAFLGRGPSILASLLSVLVFDFFLIEPRLSLSVDNTEYLLTFFGLLLVGLMISTTVARLQRQVEVTRQREFHAEALNSLSSELTGVVDRDKVLRSVVHHVHRSFGQRVVVLLPGEHSLEVVADSAALEPGAAHGSSSDAGDVGIDSVELEAAGQVYRSESHLPVKGNPPARLHYLALRTSLGPVGVLGVDHMTDGRQTASEMQQKLLQGFANLAALAIERARLAEEASQAQVLKNTERLQAALLNSISHELRTPLVSITGALSALTEPGLQQSAQPAEIAARQELVETAYEEARRMNRLVGNLLDMTRLESGGLRLNLEPCDLQDLVGISLERFGERNRDRTVRTQLADNLPLLDLDVNLMVEVLANLLENAAKYSPRNTAIDLICARHLEKVVIEIRDRGEGVASEDLRRIFDKFYRSRGVRSVSGLGLGLSISKGIVEAHGGLIEAVNREGGGLSVEICLPLP